MRLLSRSASVAITALALLTAPVGVPLGAQDTATPFAPPIPEYPLGIRPAGDNVREYVARACSEFAVRLQIEGAPPGTVTPVFIPHCAAARLFYTWTATRGTFTLYLAANAHPLVTTGSAIRAEPYPLNTRIVGASAPYPPDFTLNPSSGAGLTASFGVAEPNSYPFSQVVPIDTRIEFQAGRQAGMGFYVPVHFQFTAVPEPSTYVLLGTGLLTLGGIAARRRKRAQA